MSKHKLEYIWLDGYKPTQSLRGKTMIVEDFSGKLEDAKQWSFDGSSTEQATGDSSDCLLQPVYVIPDPDRFGGNGWLIMCEVLNPDGTPHESNGRATIDDGDDDFWFGFEQEYTLIDLETGLPLGFPKDGYPGPQGPYYTSVGAANTKGRDLVDEHLHLCLEAGLNAEGINAEVMMGQWEYQIFAKALKVQAIKFGLLATCSSVLRKRTILQSICIRSPSKAIGTVPVCMRTFRTAPCVMKVEKSSSRKFAKSSERTSTVTSASTERITTSDSPVSTKLNPLTNSVMAFRTAEPRFGFLSERFRWLEGSLGGPSPCFQW